jgi:hexosaminidase
MKIKIIYGIILVIMILTGFEKSNAQPSKTGAVAKGLTIAWEIIANNYQNKPQSRSVLVFKADNHQPLPAKGWKIYFNFARQITPASVTNNVDIKHLNGDLFCLSPSSSFKGLTAGQSLPVEFTSADWVINAKDAPDGFYWVWDNQPNQTYTIKSPIAKPSTQPEQYLRTPQDKVGLVTAEAIYQQNQTISNIAADSLIKVFPTPISYQENAGVFELNASVKISGDQAFEREKIYLKQTLNQLLLPAKTTGNSSAIILQKKEMPAEAYELTVSNHQIIITASTGAGIFYAIQSLKTLIAPKAWQQKQASIAIKNVIVKDAPRFPYRALMLDVARNFQPKLEILKLLDVMSLYKLTCCICT